MKSRRLTLRLAPDGLTKWALPARAQASQTIAHHIDAAPRDFNPAEVSSGSPGAKWARVGPTAHARSAPKPTMNSIVVSHGWFMQ
jgi:hypothetical protein